MTDEELQFIEDAVMFFYEDFNYDDYVTSALNAWNKAKEILKNGAHEDDRKMIYTSTCDCPYCQFVRRTKKEMKRND